MNGEGRTSSYSRVFLVLGGLVVAAILLRLGRGLLALFGLWRAVPAGSAQESMSPPPAFFWARPGVLLVLAAALGAVTLAVAAGAIRRRPWARVAAIAMLASGAVLGLAVAVFQVSALVRGVDRTPEAAEIGYDAVLSYWRIAAVLVGFVTAAFCAAALRRFATEDMRRQFERPPPTRTF